MSYGDDAEYSGSQRKYDEYFGIDGKAGLNGKTKPIHNSNQYAPKSSSRSVNYKPKGSNKNNHKSSYKPDYSKTYYQHKSSYKPKSNHAPKPKYAYLVKCSKCGRLYDKKLKYCPSCNNPSYDSSHYSSNALKNSKKSDESKWIRCKKCNRWYLKSKYGSCPYCMKSIPKYGYESTSNENGRMAKLGLFIIFIVVSIILYLVWRYNISLLLGS